MLFRKWGCLVGPENSIFRKLKSVDPKKMPLTTEIILHFYFPFKVFPENFTKRERARARERRRNIPVSSTITGELRAPVRADLASSSPTTAIRDRDRRFARSCHRSRSREDRDRAVARSRRRSRSWSREIAIKGAISRSVERDLAVARSRCWSRSRLREIALLIAISPSRDRAGSRSRSREAVDRDLAKKARSRSTTRLSDWIGRRWWFFSGLWLVFFWICVFLLLFQTPENIFRKIFWNATKHMETFSFSGKRFTATKHSLRYWPTHTSVKDSKSAKDKIHNSILYIKHYKNLIEQTHWRRRSTSQRLKTQK